MAENHTDSEVKEKRARQEMTLERKIEILDQLKHITNVSEFARENGLTRRNVYKLKKQEEKLRAAVVSEPLTKPMRKRLNPSNTNRKTKRLRTQDSETSGCCSSAETVKLQVTETESQIEVKPKLSVTDSEDEITGRLGNVCQFRIHPAKNGDLSNQIQSWLKSFVKSPAELYESHFISLFVA